MTAYFALIASVASASCSSEQAVDSSAEQLRRFDGREVFRYDTLGDVVDHYNAALPLALADTQKADLVEFLKSL